MARLIDADAIDKRYVPIAPVIDWGTVHYEWVAFIDDINELPTIDAVPVIRCKDCKNWEADDDERCMYCGEGVLPITEACTGFGYCSMAERKETS